MKLVFLKEHVVSGQDLMRLVHNLLPLDRIDITNPDAPHPTANCREKSAECAFRFANQDRVWKLLKEFQPHWFHPGEVDGSVEYGLKFDHLADAVHALASWMLPRAGRNDHGDKELEKQSWRTVLKFHAFEMTGDEIDRLAATAVAILYVRWQWLTAWLLAEKQRLRESVH